MIVYNKNTPFNKILSNEKFLKLEGYLEEQEGKATLAEFMYNNLGITVELLMGIKLFPFQEILLREWFNSNFSLNVWCRGASKSYLVSIFCVLWPLFYPETKIVLASNAFRSTRRLLQQMEKIINGKGAVLLKANFPLDGTKLAISRRGDEFYLPILNGGHIKALPLNSNIRGERADVLVVDEALLVAEDIFKSVLLPFLSVHSNITEQLKLDELEDKLADAGLITQDEKTLLESNKKIIGLTSASYDFEFIFRWYNEWINNVLTPPKDNRVYFVSRIGYKALPEKLIDKTIAEEAKAGGDTQSSFLREWCSIFSSSNDGFFSIKKLHEYTVKDGDLPCCQLQGNKDSKYILTIDPSFASNETSPDLFGMVVYLLNTDDRSITQVNTYGVPGGLLSDHLSYFMYLLNYFNIVMITADLGGANFNFIEAANESAIFLDKGIKLQFFDADLDSDDYLIELQKMKNSYNLSTKKICYRQTWHSEWIRKSNEYLQSQIDRGKVKFASKLYAHSSMSKRALESNVPIHIKDDNGKPLDILDFIGYQDDMVEQTKRQLALIEVRSTVNGVLQWDLPQHLRRSKDKGRARKDLYSCLLMGCWSAKTYFDMLYEHIPETSSTFTPRMI